MLYLEAELVKADEVDDTHKYQELKKHIAEFTIWINSSSGDPDPIPDEIWDASGLPRPQSVIDQPVQEDDGSDDPLKIQELQNQLTELINWKISNSSDPDHIPDDIREEADLVRPQLVIDQPVHENDEPDNPVGSEDPIISLIGQIKKVVNEPVDDSSLLLDLLANLRAALNELDAEEREKYQKEFLAISDDVVKKRKAHTEALIARIKSSENLDVKEQLLREAEKWNPSDESLGEELNQLGKEFKRGASIVEIRQDLHFLQTTINNDLNQFFTSLKRLEDLRITNPEIFTPENLAAILEARKEYDEIYRKGNELASMRATKELLDSYIAYLKIQRSPRNQEIINNQIIERTLLEENQRNEYISISAQYLQKLIDNVNFMKTTSPIFGVQHINNQLSERITREIDGKPEIIDAVPLYEDHKKLLREYRDRIIAEEVPFEEEANEFEEEAKNANSIYARVSLWIKSYNSFQKKSVHDNISKLLLSAVDERLNEIDHDYERLEKEINEINDLGLRAALGRLENFPAKLEAFDYLVNEDWFGITGYDSLIKQEPLVTLDLPPRPEALRKYTMRDKGELRIKLENKYNACKGSINTINELTIEIEELLKDPNKANVEKAIQLFGQIRGEQAYLNFKAYKDLEKLILKHEGLAKIQYRLLELLNSNDYQELIDYFYTDIYGTEEFLAAKASDRQEIENIVRQAKIGQHFQNFTRYFDNRNYLAAYSEMAWINSNASEKVEEELRIKFEDLESIFQGSQELETFYQNSFRDLLGVQDHPLLTIYSKQDLWINRSTEKDLSEKEAQFIISLLDETEKFFSDDKIFSAFSVIFSKRAFGDIKDFTERMLYLSDEFRANNTTWPQNLTKNTVRFDANKVAQICKRIIKEFIKRGLETKETNIKEIKELLNTYHSLKLSGEIEYDRIIRENAFRHANAVAKELKNKFATDEDLYEHWKSFYDLFPDDSTIVTEYSNAKRELHIRKLTSYIRNKKWYEGSKEIEKFRDDTISVDLQRIVFDFYTHYKNKEYFSSENAARVFEIIKPILQYQSDLDAPKLIEEMAAKLTVTEIVEQTEQDIVKTIEILTGEQYEKNPYILKERNDMADDLFKEIAAELSSQYERNDIRGMIDNIVTLYFLHDVTGKDLPTNIQKVFAAQAFRAQLFTFVNNTLQDANGYLHFNGSITQNISLIEGILPRISGIIKVIRSVYIQDGGEGRRRPLNFLLNLQDIDINGPSLLEIDATYANLADRKNRLHEVLREVKVLHDPKMWIEALTNTLNGVQNAGYKIIEKTDRIQDKMNRVNYDGFTDINNLLTAIRTWNNTSQTIHQDYYILRACGENEYALSCDHLNTIKVKINNLPVLFDDPEFTKGLKEHIDNSLSITPDKEIPDAPRGIKDIQSFLDRREDQIKSFTDRRDQLNHSIEEIKVKKNDLKGKNINWNNLLIENESTKTKGYNDALNKFFIAFGNGENPIPEPQVLPVPPDQPNTPDPPTLPSHPKTLIDSIKKLFGSDQNQPRITHENAMLLRRNFNGLTLEDQLVELEVMIRDISNLIEQQNLNYGQDNEINHLSQMSSDLLREIKDKINSLKKKLSLLEGAKEIADNLIKDTPLIKRSEIDKMFQQRRIPIVMKYYLDVSPFRRYADIDAKEAETKQSIQNLQNNLLGRFGIGN